MKTMIETKRIRKVSIAMLFLTMIMSTGYGQGILLEGAAKLFNSLMNNKGVPEYAVFPTNYMPTIETKENYFRLNTLASFSKNSHKDLLEGTNYNEEFSPNVVASFTVSHIEIVNENEIVTESWMTEPFSNELEAGQTVESWMTEPFSNEVEAGQAVESWMTEPFNNELEAGQTIEPWMTNEFYKEIEPAIEVEDWMITPVYYAVEESLEIEEWMAQPLI